MITLTRSPSTHWRALGASLVLLSLVPFFTPLAEDGRLPRLGRAGGSGGGGRGGGSDIPGLPKYPRPMVEPSYLPPGPWNPPSGRRRGAPTGNDGGKLRMASDGDRQQRHHRLARGGGDASSIVVEDGSGDGGGSSSDDEEDPMRRAVPWPLVPRPLTDEEIAAHRARNKTCAYASSICDRAKLCQPKFMQNRGQCGPLARRFCTRIPVARWSITPGCKECLAPSPKSCEGSDKKCAAARASCLQAKMAVPVGTLRWLSFWDENNYVPADFEGWANFGFTANVTRIIAGARRATPRAREARTPLLST